MLIKNTETRYGVVAISLHWIIAILIIGMLALGLYMADLPNSDFKSTLFVWHKEYGLLILMLVTLRICWRLINISPLLSLPWWEKYSARSIHWILYFLMLAMPFTGWALSSAANHVPVFFGITFPPLVAPNEKLADLFGTLHEWFAYLLIGIIVIHILAALKHVFFNKDDVMRRMISW